MRFFCNNKLEITIKSRAPSNTGSFFFNVDNSHEMDIDFHFSGFSWSQIFSCIYLNCPSSSSFGSFVFECPCWWQLWAPWFHVIFLFVLQFQCKLSYTHQHLLDEGLLPSCTSWATITLWGPSPNCPLQGQQALYRPHFLWYNKQKRFDTLGPSALLFLFTLFPLCLVSFFIKQAGFHLKFVFYTQLYNISTHMEYILMLRLNADTAIATNSISPCFVLIQTLYDNMHCLSSVDIICNLCGARHSLQLSCVCVV